MTNPNQPNNAAIQAIIKDQKVRREVTRNSHPWFFNIYFNHYVKYPAAPFHSEIFSFTEDDNVKNLVIVAFRGSAKSTIVNMSYPIWSILGKPQKKFILIVGQTQQQARQHIKNLKDELEANELLRADLGPLEEQDDDWRAYSIVIPKYQARITAVSVDQSIRGIRHNAHRPDLIICDDIEDLASVKTRESRDKTFQWLTSELLPAGDKNTRFAMIGNLLHEDSSIMRMKDKIEKGEIDGIFKEYPLIDEDGNCTWPGKFPGEASIERERQRIGNNTAWQREFLLRIVTDQDRVIHPGWIKYYKDFPTAENMELRFRAIGIDLAISQKTHADFTAMVSCQVHGYAEDCKIYILPNPINKRLTYLETLDHAKNLADSMKSRKFSVRLYVEDVGYQGALVEKLSEDGYYATGVKIGKVDKRSRLAMVSHLVQEGKIVFPEQGCERLIQQLVGFGLEKHDDLADAFSIVIMKLAKEIRKSYPGIIWFNIGRPDPNIATFGNIWDKKF